MTTKEILSIIRNLPDPVLEHLRDAIDAGYKQGYQEAVKDLIAKEENIKFCKLSAEVMRELIDSKIASLL